MAIDGNWNISINTPMGEKKGVIALTQDGSALTGTMTNEFGETPIEDGEANGNQLFWKVKATQPMPMTLEFDLDLDGDSLKGTVKFGPLGEAAVTGSRA